MKSDLLEIKGIGPKIEEKLFSLNIFNKRDLINFLPSGYLDLDGFSSIKEAKTGDYALARVKIIYTAKPFNKGKLKIFKIKGLSDCGFPIEITWFNANYVAHNIEIGDEIVCYGKIIKEKVARFSNPVFKKITDKTKDECFTGIKSIYRTKGLISQSSFSGFIFEAILQYNEKSILPLDILKKEVVVDLKYAYETAHFPKNIIDTTCAVQRIKTEDLVRKICAFRLAGSMYKRGHLYKGDSAIREEGIKLLPFKLSPSQNEAINTIYSKLIDGKTPLNSILIGDVGSGKTAVAMMAAYLAVKSAHQVAVMVPTDILGRQHFNTFISVFEQTGIKVGFLSSSLQKTQKEEILNGIFKGSIDIVIGTQSLLSKEVYFKDLSLVITDEQHRFGVAQRTAFIKKGLACDLLSLSATPIPRSYKMMLLGSTSVIFIENRNNPENINTAIVPKNKREKMFDYIVSKCQQGEQVFIVAPRIYDVEGIECDSVEKLYKELQYKYSSKVKIMSLHGVQKQEKKQEVLDAFRLHQADVLISTSLIEVGIDVPKASYMIIMNADRFGLASLHQLRGRIGRNGQEATCFLYTEKEESLSRLQILTTENDGIKIAEKDCEIRGMGDWLGEEQSGNKSDHQMSIEDLQRCSILADRVDITKNYEVLFNLAERYSFDRVSLN